ncbi:uncharacterized protein LOC119503395 isoform X2 [Sebastes umbrosus]|uniref:uncharacterized protein LOC119503395 isoform X2 n=1 Tax=Sebastes umbrosus TaxID=72105 RepID=UPI0018A08724|nr:uncharacterized protein LOC119503395 isoform X2 [Sebastes umbrosus]
MACSTQSALDYVKTARRYLVNGLKNLSVILENLNQERVLSNEEVSKIEAEKDDYDKNRKILDSVIKKGEDACYKFLRIVDMTRKRNLGRTSLPKRKTVASTETKEFDLHNWISCFSFKEDTQMDTNYLQGTSPCYQYQAKLKTKAQKISNQFWMANKNLFDENNKPDLSYMSLVLDIEESCCPSKVKKFKSKKIKKSRPKKLRTYIPEAKAETSPSDLLKTDKNILLVGKPGIGKTALTHEMLKLWAERDNKDLDYMFYFDMRKTSHIMKALSLEDLLFGVFSEPDEGKEEVLQDIKNSDSVTLMFDGLTDLSVHPPVVQRLVEKDLLPDAKVIVTCRPDDEEEFISDDFLRVGVKGFSEQAIKTYLSAMLGDKQKKVLSNVELLTLCHVPMYALMVAACSSFETPEDSPQPCSITEIYINIVRHCLQINSKTKIKDLDSFINNKRNEILSLAEVAFHATEEKTVNLTESPCEDSCVLSFLKPLVIRVAPTKTKTTHAFLHYTMQEFFAALWLLKNPDQIKDVFQQCLTEEKKHMKHLIPFMCRLLTEKSPSLMKCLIPAEELKNISSWFFGEMISTFLNSELFSVLFLCQCMYESQCPEACTYLLDELDYRLDLSGESLHSYLCCAVAYVVSQSKERRISLDLEDVTVSEQGMRRLFGCLENVQWCDPLPQQLSKILLLSEGQMDHMSLLGLDGNQLHLPVEGKKQLFERAVNIMQNITTKVSVCLHWERETPVCQNLCESLLEALPHISSLSFRMSYRGPGSQDQKQCHRTLERNKKQLLLDLCLKAALDEGGSSHNVVTRLLSLFSVNTDLNYILDCYQHVQSGGFSDVIPKLRPLFQSAPAVWSINLSERKTSILLEVLKLQPEKKSVELTGCSDEESEVRSFLQCLPYISQLSFHPRWSDHSEPVRFFVKLFCAAAEREQQTGEKILELLSSVCRYQTFPLNERYINYNAHKYQCDVLLDLYSHLKDYETTTGLSVLPSLQSVLQSAPAVWSIDLSERKTSILLEVLKLQPEKKPVFLRGCSDEESEVRSFLQCLPYISQLSFLPPWSDHSEPVRFFVKLFCAAAEREQQTGEKILELLSSVCRYKTFPLNVFDDDDEEEYQCDVLLDLYSHLKDYETKTGLSVLPSLQSVLQSAPAVWSINLSKRKTSILLEVLKLQPEKKPVKLTGCSDEESEVRSFLQCLPYISQLSFHPPWSDHSERVRFFVKLFCAAAEREQQTGEKILELVSSVCRYKTFPLNERYINYDAHKYPCDVLLDTYSHLKDYETKTGLSVLPSLQSVLQSAPAVWSIDLSERKTSILLEVLKLQPEKKSVELTGCSDEESEVRSFLQCLPYISQLSFRPRWSDHSEPVRFFVKLFCAAAEREQQTGEKIPELLSSVCRYQTFPIKGNWLDFLLDLYSHLKDYETTTGLSVLPSLQSVLQSAPAVWSIDLSERKTSILLEVLKLQPEKKPVKLTGCSDEESEVRSFLQCLPYISQLSFHPRWSDHSEPVRFFVKLFCAAAEREQQTGEKILELLSSVCRYQTFPLNERYINYNAHKYQCDVLLDLYSHLKDYETKTGLSVLPSLQSVFQSAPAVWSINLSERKTSILLEVLKLQPEKKSVELTGCSDEESAVRSFLQCLPYISQLSFHPPWSDHSEPVRSFVKLFCAAAEREQQTGEKILELLSSVCRYQTFPFNVIDDDDYDDDDDEEYQCDFLLDLYSHLKDCETTTGLSVLPSLQSVLQSAPAVWSINLSKRKTSILLEVLKLQPEKKPVKLTGCSDEESEVRSFLQCLPYISQLSCDPEFFQRVCSCISVRSREEAEQLSSLLQLLGFTLLLTGELPRTSCRSVGTVLRRCGSDVDLILTPRKMSVRGVFLLFRRTTQLHSLRLSNGMALLLCRWVRRERENCRVTIEELSLSPQTVPSSLRVLLKLVSSLASLLRYWTLSRLDLTDFCVPVQGLIPLLLHDGPLTIKLSKKTFHQLLSLLYEVQDKDLTWSFLSKVGGDLTSCCLNWELLHYLLQQSSAQTITVNVRKNSFLQESIARLLPFLDRIVFKRPCPTFVLTAIREIYRAGAGPIIPSLLRSLDHVISLTGREMDSVDCAALLFTLKHSDRVKLDLLWTSIPAGEIESILFMLDKVSQLSVDRNLLLRLVHCCAASEAQQGAAVSLLRTVQHRLDLSCSSCVNLDQRDTLHLTGDDCRAVSTILRRRSRDTQLILQDCEVEDGGLDLLFPVLDRVRLRASKAVLLQLVSLVHVNSERDRVRRAVSLCRALDGELDLSHTTLDQRVCGALAWMLYSSEELTELDLSHCQLTDQLLLTLSSHLHKVQVLDLSHNNITDASTAVLLQVVSTNPSIDTVRLFRNNIVDTTSFKKDKKFEIW